MKRKNKLLSITIGIPAYNEMQNISNLLHSIVMQEQSAYHLDKILVVSDGSSDKTDDLVQRLSKKYPKIHLLADKNRLGRTARLNQINRLNKSEILVTIDADVTLSTPQTLNALISGFSKKQIVYVGVDKQVVKPSSFVGKIIYYWYCFSYEMRKDLHHGNNIYNTSGVCLAVRSSFMKSVEYPKDVIATASYLYLTVLQKKYEFYFAKNAQVSLLLPNTFSDLFSLIFRSPNESENNEKVFGSWINKEYSIPRSVKLKALLLIFIQNPFYAPLVVLLQIYLRLAPSFQHKHKKVKNGIWETVQSTKKPVSVTF